MERLGEVTQQLQTKLHRLTVGRFLQARAKGNSEAAAAFAERQNWVDRSDIVLALKTATSDIGTSDIPLTRDPVSVAFLNALRALSIPLRLEGMRRVPILTRVFTNTGGIVATQVAESGRIPVLRSTWNPTTLEPRKIGAITVVTQELLEHTSNEAQLAVADDLTAAVAEAENLAFISPNETDSVLDGAPSFASTGSAVSNVDADLRSLVKLVPGAGHPGAAFVMSKTSATYLGTLRGTGGAAAYPDLGPNGGTLLRLPVLTSAACEFDDSPESGFIGLLSPSEILFNEGDVVLAKSTQAALVQDDDPDNAGADAVSMFQADAVALRALRRVAWYAKPGAGAYFTVAY